MVLGILCVVERGLGGMGKYRLLFSGPGLDVFLAAPWAMVAGCLGLCCIGRWEAIVGGGGLKFQIVSGWTLEIFFWGYKFTRNGLVAYGRCNILNWF